MSTGIVVLGHGSRREVGEANQTLVELAGMVRRAMSLELMEIAFMNEKSGLQGLGPAIDRLVEAGATRVVILPVFLAAGMHMQKDIPAGTARARDKYPDIEITLTGHIGADPRLVPILVEKLSRALDEGALPPC
ncbi:MAG: CbiX/SirB N-terminal domain-containing protein [Peptococcaceae bacterium]|jgi:sirohydrochlorin ferrochelatase|nr:CbiX/SirB N-terminal domain-containing protein [Peptococcaceae bacterium]